MYDTAETYRKISLADFNGDGRLDMIAATHNSPVGGGARLFMNNGDGTFTERKSFGPYTADYPDIDAGDVNNDGKMDFIFGDELQQGVVYLGDGTGNFSAAATLNYVCQPDLVDVNGDNKLDLVARSLDGGNNTHLSVALGLGNGTFGARVTFGHIPTGGTNYYRNITNGDFNGDGKVDLASSTSNTIQVFLGAGNGTFGPALSISLASVTSTGQTFAADVTGDGKTDLITTGLVGASQNVYIYAGLGNGAFASAVTYGGGLFTGYFVATDLNGDGATDLVSGRREESGGILWGNSKAAAVSGVLRVEEIDPVRISSAGLATLALDRFEALQSNLGQVRGVIAGGLSRSEQALFHASSMSVELGAAAAKIRDIDVAAEVAEMVKRRVIVESTSALFAQANLQQQTVLSLVKALDD